MKKLIIAIIVFVLLVGGYYYIRTHAQVTLGILEGKTTKAYRGDLERPIIASGKIEPATIVKIKGEASGEVVETPFNDGAMVRKDDVIVRLDPDDEQRNVDQAEADYESAKIALDQAKLAKKDRSEAGVAMAEAQVKQAEARYNRLKTELDFKRPLTQPSSGMPTGVTIEEWSMLEASGHEAEANVAAMRAQERQARLAVEQAALEIRTAKERVTTAEKRLEDARERLKETTVVSPIDGMVLSRLVQIGEMVQSGTQSLTGGTVLMEIADVSDIYAVVNVDEADIGEVRELAPPSAVPGPASTQPAELPDHVQFDKERLVEVSVESFPQEKFYGVIERVAPQSQLMQAIATFRVWIRIASDNKSELIGLLNTQAEAHFTVKSVTDAILVSYDAIKKDPNGEGYGVYVSVMNPVTGKPDAEFKRCQFGIDNGEDVEVIEGLGEGDKVYTRLPQKTEKEKQAEEQAGE